MSTPSKVNQRSGRGRSWLVIAALAAIGALIGAAVGYIELRRSQASTQLSTADGSAAGSLSPSSMRSATTDPSSASTSDPTLEPSAATDPGPATTSARTRTGKTTSRTSTASGTATRSTTRAGTPRPATSPSPAAVAAGLTATAQTLPDLAYASPSATQKLDLYLPERTGATVPLVIMIHGGGFADGDKSSLRAAANSLREKGFAVASVNYRLSGEARFPAGGQDVKAAVRWLRAKAGSYGIDPARFAVWGHSAGGYMAAMLGLTGAGKSVFDGGSLGNAAVSSAVQLVVDLSGPTDFTSMDRDAAAGGCAAGSLQHDAADSPESLWLGGPVPSMTSAAASASLLRLVPTATSLPPFVIVHGQADCSVPTGQSQALAAALQKRKADVTLTVLPGVGHSIGGGEADLYAPAVRRLEHLLDGAGN